MDNHQSHCTLENIQYAKDNHIFLLTFPPHLTDRRQPLDVGVYFPFKNAMKFALQDEIDSSGGKPINLSDLPKISIKAFSAALNTDNIKAGFEKTGIWPIDRLKYRYKDVLLAKSEDDIDDPANVSDLKMLLPFLKLRLQPQRRL